MHDAQPLLKSLCAALYVGGGDAEPGDTHICELQIAAALVSGASGSSKSVTDGVVRLDQLRAKARAEMQDAACAGKGDPFGWRCLYTDASLLRALGELANDGGVIGEDAALANIAVLDYALVMAGAAGDGRYELVTDAIALLQRQCRPPSPTAIAANVSGAGQKRSDVTPTSSSRPVPSVHELPSLGRFVRDFAHAPLVVRGYARDWPALNERPWASSQYLRAVAGRGRMVPVEVGSDYRADDWTQEMMSWEDFLSGIADDGGKTLYLAQHDLFFQFPELQRDIIIPDYVYSAPRPPPDFLSYEPPANAEQLVVNAWLGPKGTISPAHTPLLALLLELLPVPRVLCDSDLIWTTVQVVGRKTVWLAPPAATDFMHSFSPPPPSSLSGNSVHNPATNTTAPSMSNTSRVDVFAREEEGEYASFWKHAVPLSMHVTLEPGDALLFPPGWWHAMRSEEKSFSVSMWY